MGLFDGTPLERPVTCERCGKSHGQCGCPRDRLSGQVLREADQQLRIRREQRRGKFVTVVAGFAARSEKTDDLPVILKGLKAKLATGGTVEGTTLEVQGDHRDRLVEHFKSLGYPAKAAGG
ncbi:MAG: translation initiation factor [Planctomycetaceae bacterium]|jgi:translation initiation factor 1|nr:translation initiation factor [Phycisphaerales bacterium]MCE2653959.1 translation initiation factor [Planctomycetaceae bacterium]